MPWVDIPHRELRLFYLINPTSQVKYASSHTDPVPECDPLDPDKANLVLIHSSLNSIATWSAQFSDPRLRTVFNLIGFDARCHGRTDGTERKDQRLEDSANCIIAGLDALGLNDYVMVGEGYHGSTIAAWTAIKRPEKTKGIVLVSPGHPSELHANISAFTDISTAYCAARSPSGTPDGDSQEFPEELREGIAAYFLGEDSRLQERKEEFKTALELRYGKGHSSHDIFIVCRFATRDPIPADQLAKIDVPVLILQGGADKVASPVKGAEEWRDLLQNARGGADLKVIASAPHLLSFTDANIANRFILGFGRRCI